MSLRGVSATHFQTMIDRLQTGCMTRKTAGNTFLHLACLLSDMLDEARMQSTHVSMCDDSTRAGVNHAHATVPLSWRPATRDGWSGRSHNVLHGGVTPTLPVVRRSVRTSGNCD